MALDRGLSVFSDAAEDGVAVEEGSNLIFPVAFCAAGASLISFLPYMLLTAWLMK